MKFFICIALGVSFSSVFASENFGGIDFHSSVPQDQIDYLKTDLTYLYKTPVSQSDPEFLKMIQLKVGDGPQMHNWVLNRARYIVGETYDLTKNVIVDRAEGMRFKFPTTPLPSITDSIQKKKTKSDIKNIMSNMGTVVYLAGKQNSSLLGINFDNKIIFAKSPRIGVLKIGEGLFAQKFLFNKNPKASVNSLSRLGTLFHESRHSDGSGASTGFIHANCPSGHAYVGHAACDLSSNGPYTIGALALRHLLLNCTTCSLPETTAIEAAIADSFGRILGAKKIQENQIYSSIAAYQSLIQFYQKQLELPGADKEKIKKEIDSFSREVALLEEKLVNLAKVSSAPETWDPSPEGTWVPLTLKESMKAMTNSLNRR